jgi:hypothetical protein
MIGCTLVALFTVQCYAGFFLFFVAIVWAFGLLLCVISFFRNRLLFPVKAVKLTMWLVTMLVVVSIHWYYAVDARRVANFCALSIEHYRNAHGAYPTSLKAASLDERKARQLRLGYVLDVEGPNLFYPSTFNGFDTYFYDFRSRTWEFHPD